MARKGTRYTSYMFVTLLIGGHGNWPGRGESYVVLRVPETSTVATEVDNVALPAESRSGNHDRDMHMHPGMRVGMHQT